MAENDRRHPNVVNVDELSPRTVDEGRFAFQTRWFTRATGAKGLGCSWFEVPPGKTAFPTHYHCANEEAVFVLEGDGIVRIGDRTIVLRAGDYVTFPTGPEHAHQIMNTGGAPLRYLAFSTLLPVEVVGYPDSKKVGTIARPRFGEAPWVHAIYRVEDTVDYYDREKKDP